MAKRFWVADEFIDNHACNLSLKAQMTYICLCRHANREGQTTIGIRGIAIKLGLNKDSVARALRELELSGLVGQRPNKLSGFSPYTVRNCQTEVSESVGHKEVGIIKELPKQDFQEIRKQLEAIKEQYSFLRPYERESS